MSNRSGHHGYRLDFRKVVEGLSAAIKTVDPTLLAITALLDVIGVDQDTIELVKSIYASAAASIVMATVMIGAAVICSVAIGAVVSALSKTAAEEVTKEITSTIKSTIESIIKSVSKKYYKGIKQSMQHDTNISRSFEVDCQDK